MKNLLELTGKIAIVTGASSGMGREIARLFAEQGATVIALARREERLKELAQENERIIPFVADVTKEEDLENVFLNVIHAVIVLHVVDIVSRSFL